MANLVRSGRKTEDYKVSCAFFGKIRKNSPNEGKQQWHLNLFLNRRNKNGMYVNFVYMLETINLGQ
jgi:hypothetical protein